MAASDIHFTSLIQMGKWELGARAKTQEQQDDSPASWPQPSWKRWLNRQANTDFQAGHCTAENRRLRFQNVLHWQWDVVHAFHCNHGIYGSSFALWTSRDFVVFLVFVVVLSLSKICVLIYIACLLLWMVGFLSVWGEAVVTYQEVLWFREKENLPLLWSSPLFIQEKKKGRGFAFR